MTKSPLRLVTDFPPLDRDAWRQVVERDLKGAPFDKRVVTRLYEGLDVQPLYLPEDWPVEGDASGLPGQPPATRGFSALSAESGWSVLQRYSHPDPSVVSKCINQELARGVDGVLLELAASAEGASKDGLTVRGLADLDAALEGVPLAQTPIAVDASGNFFEAAAMLVALWEKRGVARSSALGAFNADPIGCLAETGGQSSAMAVSLRSLGELAAFSFANLPSCTSVQVSTAAYNNAGATATQELAVALATGVAYLKAMESAGLSPEDAAGQIVVRLPVGCDQFLEIAKLRALRALWSTLLAACGVPREKQTLRLHAVTADRIITERDPWVNMLRTTVSCFSAAVGGADMISVAPFDSAIGHADPLGRRVARNTQIVLKEESHLAKVTDPSGGCWYVETLTEQLADTAWREFQDIESRGGILSVLKDGSLRAAIETIRAQRALDIARRKQPITGVTEFPNLQQAPVTRETPDLEAIATASQQRLEKAAAPTLDSALQALNAAPPGNRWAATVEATKSGATTSQLMSTATGGDADIPALPSWRLSSDFEVLRTLSDSHLGATGKRPRVFLANLGPVAHHTARAAFTQNFFEAGGFEVETNGGFADAASAAQALKASGAPLAVICSSDSLYESLVGDVAPALRAAGVTQLLLAGRPGAQEDTYRKSGVDGFIFIGCNVLQTLSEQLRAQGVLS